MTRPPSEPIFLNASQVVLLSFTTIIALGTALLALPFAHAGAPHALVDDFFNAASAVCVTGLITLDPSTDYSLFGQWVILLLVQVGGLGYMTLFTVIMILIGRNLTMRDRLNIQQATDQPGMRGLVGFVLHIIRFTVIIEGLGFLLLCLQTVPEFGLGRGTYLALFHAVSAFNNSGFSLFPDGAAHWQTNAFPLLVIAGLVIIGSLGYNVNHELVRRYLFRQKGNARWNVLITIVLTATGILLTAGTLAIWVVEHNNPATLGPLSLPMQIVNAFFMAVQPRSAGFSSVDTASLYEATLTMLMPLMFIGAGPGGTGGGIKLTTAAVMVAAVLAVARGQQDVNLGGLRRRVGQAIVLKAFTVFFLSLTMVMVVATILADIEPLPFMNLLFETVSAFSIAGLSTGITSELSSVSKLLLVLTMLAGRVGMLTILLAVFNPREKSAVRYQEEPLLIG